MTRKIASITCLISVGDAAESATKKSLFAKKRVFVVGIVEHGRAPDIDDPWSEVLGETVQPSFVDDGSS